MIAANGFAQGVIDVHSHIITPEFVSALETEGRVMDEGFPLPKYNVKNHVFIIFSRHAVLQLFCRQRSKSRNTYYE